MNYKILLLLLLFSCTVYEKDIVKKDIIFDETFSNTGFTLIFNKNLKKQKLISKNIEQRSLTIFQKNLKKNTSVKITNLKNNKIKLHNNLDRIGDIIKKRVDYTMCAISGLQGLKPTIDSIKLSKTIAIANKETIICGWHIIEKALKKKQKVAKKSLF